MERLKEGAEVGTTAGSAAENSASRTKAARLGFKPGQVLQEFGYDDDVDVELRAGIEEITGTELEDEDAQDVMDGVVYWWRDGDGDLVDGLVDALTNLVEGGVIWLLTPKAGRSGHVEPSDIEDAAPTAGLHATSTVTASADWTGTRLASPKGARR
jgi:hypothetical protein